MVRDKISTKFQTIIDILREREKELLTELEEFETNYEREQDERDRDIKVLNDLLERTESNLGESEMLMSLKHQHLQDIEDKLRDIRSNSSKSFVTLSWNDELLQSAQKVGSIEIRERVSYQHKKNPVLESKKRGGASTEMKFPTGLAIDPKSYNIFIADNAMHRIQVFDQRCQFLYKFGEYGAGKLKQPWAIAIGNDKVFVIHSGPKLFSYELNGKFLTEFGKNEVSHPTGLAVSDNSGDIYVCDLNKDIIFVYSQDLKYKTSFGKDKLSHPRDIKLNQEKIFVLDDGNPCVHIFNRDLSYSHSIVSRGKGNDVDHALFFTLDYEENILISDYNRNVVSVFNQRGELIHQIGNGSDLFYKPKGIVIDSKNRIVIVDDKQEGSLKLF